MPPLLLHIVLNGKDFGMRRWSAVPRIGDKLVIGNAGDTTAVKVIDIVWGVTPASRRGETDAEIDVVCNGTPPRSKR